MNVTFCSKLTLFKELSMIDNNDLQQLISPYCLKMSVVSCYLLLDITNSVSYCASFFVLFILNFY